MGIGLRWLACWFGASRSLVKRLAIVALPILMLGAAEQANAYGVVLRGQPIIQICYYEGSIGAAPACLGSKAEVGAIFRSQLSSACWGPKTYVDAGGPYYHIVDTYCGDYMWRQVSTRHEQWPGLCPANATDSGGQCVCNAGFQPNFTAAACVAIPVEDQACGVGNPTLPGTGRKLHHEDDYAGAGNHALNLRRFYRSEWADGASSRGLSTVAHGTGGWKLSLHASLTVLQDGKIRAFRPDGSTIAFDPSPSTANAWVAQGSRDTLTATVSGAGQRTGFTYVASLSDNTETYDAAGKQLSIRERNGWTSTFSYSDSTTPISTAPVPGLLISVRNQFGRELRFTYDAQGRIAEFLPPGAVAGMGAGSATSPIRYAYNEAASLGLGVSAANQLTSVTWQDGKVRRYHYEDTRFPLALTGITDEAGARYATYSYDAQSRVLRSEHAGGADRVDFAYGFDALGARRTTVTDYTGPNASATQRTYSFAEQAGVLRTTGVTAPCSLCGNTQQSTTYGADGSVIKAIGHDGKPTFYAYDARGRATERATYPASYASAATRPALGAAEMVISTLWHATLYLPLQIAEPGKYREYAYDTSGNVVMDSVVDTTDATGAQKFAAVRTDATRAKTYWTYNTSHLPTSMRQTLREKANGKGGTETGRWTLTYNVAGDVTRTTHVASDAASNVLSYDAHGRMLTGSDDSGAPVSFQYSPRGFVLRKARGVESITFVQNAIGLTTEVRMPDNQTLRYVYDVNHKLVDVLLNGASITPAMLAKSEFPDTQRKALIARAAATFEQIVSAVIPPAYAQAALQAGRGVVPAPGRPMPGQPEFDPRRDMMSMAPMSDVDKAARDMAEEFARWCECKPDGGFDRPTFSYVSFAHVLFSGHLSPRFSDKSYFASTEKVGQALVDEVVARGREAPGTTAVRMVIEADLVRQLGSVGYARTKTGAFVPTNRVRLVYERRNCGTRFHARNEVVTIYPI